MDDVAFLKAHATEESYLVLVDSRKRDVGAFPHASHYEVEFARPFRNVFSVDLVDASVPRTEYLVDDGRNALTYSFVVPAAPGAVAPLATSPDARRAVVPPGDYNIATFAVALGGALAAAAAAAGDDDVVRVEALTTPGETSNRLVLLAPRPFCVLAAHSSMRHVLGFGDPVVTAASAAYAPMPGWDFVIDSPADHVFVSRPAAEAEAAALTGPAPLGDGVATVVDGTLRQRFVAAAGGEPATLRAFCALAPGATLTATLVAADDVDETAIAVATIDAASADPEREPAVAAFAAQGTLDAGAQYVVLLTAEPDGGVTVFRAENNFSDGPAFSLEDGGGDEPGGQACVDVTCVATAHRMVTPGLVDLTGERYVSVRCPEVEQHMYRDRAFETHHAGMGMVKMGGYGYAQQRWDFQSFPPRRMPHPIGKLPKLTIRLERDDGTLYDTRGCDHTLLIVVRYYAPPAAGGAGAGGMAGIAAATRVLNPAYDPDYRNMRR